MEFSPPLPSPLTKNRVVFFSIIIYWYKILAFIHPEDRSPKIRSCAVVIIIVRQALSTITRTCEYLPQTRKGFSPQKASLHLPDVRAHNIAPRLICVVIISGPLIFMAEYIWGTICLATTFLRIRYLSASQWDIPTAGLSGKALEKS